MPRQRPVTYGALGSSNKALNRQRSRATSTGHQGIGFTASNAAHVELVGDEFCRWGHGTLLHPGGEAIIRRALQERLLVHI